MKNKSLILIIPFLVFIFICGVNNVKAEENYIIKSYYSPINSKFVDSNITITEEQVNNIFMTDKEKFIEYDNQTTYGKGYIKSLLSMFDKGSFEEYLNNYDSWIVVNDDSRNGDRLYFFNKEDIYLKAINESSSSKYFSVVIKQGYAYSYYSNSYWKINDQILSDPNLYYSNSNITRTYPDTQNYKTLLLSSSDLIKLSFGNTLTPEINITKFGETSVNDAFGNEKISSITYNINFTTFNLNNYKYLYSFNNKDWTSISENDYKLLVKENGTFYVKVTDMNDNYITSATFTTTGIDGVPPNIINDVNFEKDGVTYNHLLKIPVKYLYNQKERKFKDYSVYFLSKSKDDPNSEFYITLENEGEGKELPVIVNFYENIKDISQVIIDKGQTAGSSGNYHTSGGGRHDIGGTCDPSNLPYQTRIYNDNTNYYNILYLKFNSCSDYEVSLSDFSTTYVYVYYNARLYENLDSITKDYEDNPDNFESSDKNFVDYISTALNYFVVPVKEIIKLVTYFFNGMPPILRYMFITLFIVGIVLIVYQLLL